MRDAPLTGLVTMVSEPANERDEIVRLVRRIKEADVKLRSPQGVAIASSALAWAESWQLPMDVFQYFTVEETAPHSGR
jgi:hypothetical protein